jgi:hypothetical protein
VYVGVEINLAKIYNRHPRKQHSGNPSGDVKRIRKTREEKKGKKKKAVRGLHELNL